MNFKKIIIFDFKVMFDILNEIKDYLNFQLDYADKNNLESKVKDSDTNLLVLSNKKISNLKDDINIVIEKTPIEIKKVIQTINLHFLRNNFAKQSEQKIGVYKLNLNSREIAKDQLKLNLTERETNMILFMSNSKSPVNVDQLEKEVWNYESELDTHTVETHIYRLRKKIKEILYTRQYSPKKIKPKKGKGSFKRQSKKVKI